jgi:hypothetical protein
MVPISSSPVTRRGSLAANPHSGQVRIKKSGKSASWWPNWDVTAGSENAGAASTLRAKRHATAVFALSNPERRLNRPHAAELISVVEKALRCVSEARTVLELKEPRWRAALQDFNSPETGTIVTRVAARRWQSGKRGGREHLSPRGHSTHGRVTPRSNSRRHLRELAEILGQETGTSFDKHPKRAPSSLPSSSASAS